MSDTYSGLHPATSAMRERTFSNLSSRASSQSRSSMGRYSSSSYRMAPMITFLTDPDAFLEVEDEEEDIQMNENGIMETNQDESPTVAEDSFIKEFQDEVSINLDPIDVSEFSMEKIPDLIQEILLKMGVPQKNLLDHDIKSKSQTKVIISLGKRMEKMQFALDDVSNKLALASSEYIRIKADRDDIRRTLYYNNKEMKEMKSELRTMRENGGRIVQNFFKDDEIIQSLISDIQKKALINAEKVMQRDGNEEIHLQKNETQTHQQDKKQEKTKEQEYIERPTTTIDRIRKLVDMIEARKRFEAPSCLGTGLKSNLLTNDDISNLNPYKQLKKNSLPSLDAPEYQKPKMRQLVKKATNHIQDMFSTLAKQNQELLKAKDSTEYIRILHEQLSECVASVHLCLDVLAEEQMYASKWKSKWIQTQKELNHIQDIFSRSNIESAKIFRKYQRLVNSGMAKKDYQVFVEMDQFNPKLMHKVSSRAKERIHTPIQKDNDNLGVYLEGKSVYSTELYHPSPIIPPQTPSIIAIGNNDPIQDVENPKLLTSRMNSSHSVHSTPSIASQKSESVSSKAMSNSNVKGAAAQVDVPCYEPYEMQDPIQLPTVDYINTESVHSNT